MIPVTTFVALEKLLEELTKLVRLNQQLTQIRIDKEKR